MPTAAYEHELIPASPPRGSKQRGAKQARRGLATARGGETDSGGSSALFVLLSTAGGVRRSSPHERVVSSSRSHTWVMLVDCSFLQRLHTCAMTLHGAFILSLMQVPLLLL